jgi:hypothetical protein
MPYARILAGLDGGDDLVVHVLLRSERDTCFPRSVYTRRPGPTARERSQYPPGGLPQTADRGQVQCLSLSLTVEEWYGRS